MLTSNCSNNYGPCQFPEKLIPLMILNALEGKPFGTSSWFTIDQDRIDKFADVTEDWQYIHCDPEAAKKTPFGTRKLNDGVPKPLSAEASSNIQLP